MLKKLITSVALLALSLAACVKAADQAANPAPISLSCVPQLRPYMDKILKIPQGRQLIEKIHKEGAIRITLNQNRLSSQFGAFWDADRRVICLNLDWHRNEGAIIGSLLFELHNALASSQLDHIDYLASTGQIGRESYIRSIEHVEYQNSHKASKLAEAGISMGLFPVTARLPTYHTFEEHYRVQKMGGHSAWIARNYDQLAPRSARKVIR